jgi:hypothetical protein
MRPHQLVLSLIPLLNLHATRTFASQSVFSVMSADVTSTVTDITKLANGVEVQNSGVLLEGKRKQVVEDVLNVRLTVRHRRVNNTEAIHPVVQFYA